MPRTKNSKKFQIIELETLFELMDRYLPFGQQEWENVASKFMQEMHARVGPRATHRDYESLRNKFKLLKNTRKPTGDPNCPWEVKRAKRLQRAIEQRMSTREG